MRKRRLAILVTVLMLASLIPSAASAVIPWDGDELYTTDGTFTVPANVSRVYVVAVGGGGGGGGGGYQKAGGAGGSGAVAEAWLQVSTGDELTVKVGGGGDGGVYRQSDTYRYGFSLRSRENGAGAGGGGGGFSGILAGIDILLVAGGGGGGGGGDNESSAPVGGSGGHAANPQGVTGGHGGAPDTTGGIGGSLAAGGAAGSGAEGAPKPANSPLIWAAATDGSQLSGGNGGHNTNGTATSGGANGGGSGGWPARGEWSGSWRGRPGGGGGGAGYYGGGGGGAADNETQSGSGGGGGYSYGPEGTVFTSGSAQPGPEGKGGAGGSSRDDGIPGADGYVRIYYVFDGTISGRVIAKGSSDPIEGATVGVGTQTTSTLADGTFTLALFPGTYTVTVSKTGFTTAQLAGVGVESDEDTALGDIVLGGQLTVNVIDEYGAPLEGAEVSVAPAAAFAEPDPQTTGSGGSVSWSNVDIGAELSVAVTKDGYRDGSDDLTLSLEEPHGIVTIQVGRFCTLNVRRVGQGTVSVNGGSYFTPTDDSSVTFDCIEPYVSLEARASSGWRFDHWQICPGCGVWEYEGRVEANSTEFGLLSTETPECLILDSAYVELEFNCDCECAEGVFTATAHFVRIPGEPSGPSGTVTVNVVKSDGGSVDGLSVSITGPVSATLTTNSTGSTTLGGLYSGTYIANASAPGYESSGPINIVLASDSGSASGTITLTAVIESPPEPPEQPPVEPEQPVVEPPTPPAGEPESPPSEPGTPDLPKTGTSYLATTLVGLAALAAGAVVRRRRRG